MTRPLLTSLLALLAASAATPALAQPAARRPAPSAPTPPAAAAPAALPDDMVGFDKDVDALFAGGGLTADQAAARAAGASPDVRRRAAELQVQIVAREQSSLNRLPFVQGKASYTRLSYIAPVSLGFGGMNFTIPFLQNSYDFVATTQIPLSDYVFRYPRLMKSSDFAIELAKTSAAATAVNAGQDARIAYYEWVRSKLQLLVSQRQLRQVQATLTQEQALADAQRVSKADLLRVESQEAEAEQSVDQLANAAMLREEQLRLLIGATDSEPLAIGEDIRADMNASSGTALDELVKRASSQRLDLKQIDVGIEQKKQAYKAEEANLYPKLSAFATAEDARPNQRIFPQVDEFRFTWLAGAQVTWTLGDATQAHVNRRRLEAEAAELRADRDNFLKGNRIELLSAQQAVSIAVHALATSQKGLAAAEEGYRVRRELLAADRATAVELVDVETDLTRARIAALNARVDLRVALAQLAHATGDDVATAAGKH